MSGIKGTYTLEEGLDVCFVHPWLDIANPEGFGAELLRLLVG
jgi:hypothetical protein